MFKMCPGFRLHWLPSWHQIPKHLHENLEQSHLNTLQVGLNNSFFRTGRSCFSTHSRYCRIKQLPPQNREELLLNTLQVDTSQNRIKQLPSQNMEELLLNALQVDTIQNRVKQLPSENMEELLLNALQKDTMFRAWKSLLAISLFFIKILTGTGFKGSVPPDFFGFFFDLHRYIFGNMVA